MFICVLSRKIHRTLLALAAAVFLPLPCLFSQAPLRMLSPEEHLAAGDSLHAAYRFEEALSHYMSAFGSALDADRLREIDERMVRSQNALNMTDFCARPHVVARQRFSRRDFYQFYPLKAQGWHPSPNVLDSLEGYPTYLPKDGRTVYFSAADAAGARNLYVSYDRDSLWSAPELLGESLLSTGNEIYPILSPDGKTLYFSSDGLHGMGGYDLYRSSWDEAAGRWGEPENLGFPYSSPSDDFLMMDTEDGKYTLFASNRDCSRDSVYIYVLEYDPAPVRTAVRSTDDLVAIASLRPVDDPFRMDAGSAVSEAVPESDNTRLYMRKMDEARALRDSIYVYEKALDDLRLQLSRSAEEGRAALTASIREKEAALTPLREQLDDTSAEIRLIEQSFLRSGVVSSSGRADREVVGASSGYTFTKNGMGGRLRLKVGRRTPAPADFSIMPVGRFAQDNSLPSGVVFQIQIFTAARHASLDDIRGLCPVYERLTSSLRYTYAVGLFRSYADALTHLNAVRRLGFRDATVIAWRDGRPVPAATAASGAEGKR